MKQYSFTDKFNNQYNFETYLEFAKFWFNLNRKTQLSYFPDNFKRLNYLAVNSKQAKIKI